MKFIQQIRSLAVQLISNPKAVLFIYIILALIVSLQSYLLESKSFEEGAIKYTNYNNYVIFKKSFDHLVNYQDLYILYPEEQWDLYKYTPTFSAFFGLFSIFPDFIGLTLWNLLNVLILYFAIYYLPKLNNFQKGLSLTFLIFELITSIQNSQSNALIAGLLVLTFGLLEKKHYFWATFCVLFSVFIKIFGIVGFALFLFYPNKLKLIKYSFFWLAIFLVTPFIFIDFDQYTNLNYSFLKMLGEDHSVSYGLSVMGWLNSWFSINLNKNYIVLMGIIVFLIPLLKINLYKDFRFRFLNLISILIWIVIFNHKAESPTFVIAMTGVTIWFFYPISTHKYILYLFLSALILTSLSPTDIFPKFIRNEFIIPYTLKAIPCIFIWFSVIFEMILMKKEVK